MPSKKQYDLVTEDGADSLIPVHSEEAFKLGVTFEVKYIGCQEVPRPTSRVEIVAAMRRVRFDFKARQVKKQYVHLTVSGDGVTVSVYERPQHTKKNLLNANIHDFKSISLAFHPINRIFYVSHDSQDTLIFSFIARGASSNVFTCNVFKAAKKSQAMRIVRTIGQAFDVCHRLSVVTSSQHVDGDVTSDHVTGMTSSCKAANCKDTTQPDAKQKGLSSPHKTAARSPRSQRSPSSKAADVQPCSTVSPVSPVSASDTSQVTPVSTQHTWHLLRHQADQQEQHTRSALAQVQLLNTQLASETAARLEAQNRVQQLLKQNRELLEHINSLVGHMHRLETQLSTTIPQPQNGFFNALSRQQSWSNDSGTTVSADHGRPSIYSTASSDFTQGQGQGYPITVVTSISSVPTTRSTALPNTSPSRQQLSLSLTNPWSSVHSHTISTLPLTASAHCHVTNRVPTGDTASNRISQYDNVNRMSQAYSDTASNRVSQYGDISRMTYFGDTGTSSDLGSSSHSSTSYSPGDRLDFLVATSPVMSDSVLSPADYMTGVTGDTSTSTNCHIPRIEPPPRTIRPRSNRLSIISNSPATPSSDST